MKLLFILATSLFSIFNIQGQSACSIEDENSILLFLEPLAAPYQHSTFHQPIEIPSCDNSNLIVNNTSLSSILGVCGNGILETGEECDDGNLIDSDGCSSSCIIEPIMVQTYLIGDIPTSYNDYDQSCNGASTEMFVDIPFGYIFNITSVRIKYNMTAQAGAWKSEQRSTFQFISPDPLVGFIQTDTISGAGDAIGTHMYNNTYTELNGSYNPGDRIIFELQAWRTWEGTAGCNTAHNKIDAGTWTIEIFGEANIPKGVSVNDNYANSTLTVNGAIALGNNVYSPVEGMIRYYGGDFEGFSQNGWVSLTQSGGGGWGSTVTQANQRITSPTPNASALMGQSVAVDKAFSSSAAIGAPGEDGAGPNTGAVYMYTGGISTWQKNGRIVPQDSTQNHFFGGTVANLSHYLAVGAIGDDTNGTLSGAVYIYKQTSVGAPWVFHTKLTADDGSAEDYFGKSIAFAAINDTAYVVIGAYGDDDGGSQSGSVYVFQENGSTWDQKAKLKPLAHHANDFFGLSLDAYFNRIVIGAPGYDESPNTENGRAFVFKKSGNAWTEEQALFAISMDTYDDMYLGSSVSMDADAIVVGAPGAGKKGANSGSVHIFTKNIDFGGWYNNTVLYQSDGMPDDLFGTSVCIYNDTPTKNTILVGAPGRSDFSENEGMAYIYSFEYQQWKQKGMLQGSDLNQDDNFGTSVSLSYNSILIGADGKDVDGNTDAGKAYFFNKK